MEDQQTTLDLNSDAYETMCCDDYALTEHEPSSPCVVLSNAEESVILSMAPVPQQLQVGQSVGTIDQKTDVAGEDYDYLFDSEPSPVEFSSPEVARENAAPIVYNEPTLNAEHNESVMGLGCSDAMQEPMMSGALVIHSDATIDCRVTSIDNKVPRHEESNVVYEDSNAHHDPYGQVPLVNQCSESDRSCSELRRPEVRVETETDPASLNSNISEGRTPTEAYLESVDFQLHKVIENIESKHTRRALQATNQDLSRQELFRVYRSAAEAECDNPGLSRPLTPSQECDSDELENPSNSEHEDGTSPCDTPEGGKQKRKNSIRCPSKARTSDIKLQAELSSESSSAEASRSSLIHSMPYLSEITPVEAQGHHPSTIPRSPRRNISSGTSSLSSEAMPTTDTDVTPHPLTEGALATQDSQRRSRTLPNPAFPGPFIDRQTSPFRRPTEPASASSPYTRSPLRRAFDSIDASSTKAMVGSPAQTPSLSISRPDTPRPSFAVDSIAYLIEAAYHEPSVQLGKSASSAPRAELDVNMLDSSSEHSPTPARRHASTHNEDVIFTLSPARTPHQTSVAPIRRSYLPDTPDNASSHVSGQPLAFPAAATSASPSPVRPTHPTELKPLAHWLDEPWKEPALVKDKLSDRPSSRTPSPSKRVTRSSPHKKPSDNFVAGTNEMSLSFKNISPPLSPQVGVADQIYRSKRGQKKATASRRAVTGPLASNAKTPKRGRSTVAGGAEAGGKRSKSTNLGVQGGGVKVTKPRAAGVRSTSRKVSARTPRRKRADADAVPEVPPLPTAMDIDRPENEAGKHVEPSPHKRKATPSSKKRESVKMPSTPERSSPGSMAVDTPQGKIVGTVEHPPPTFSPQSKTKPPATPDVREAVEREQQLPRSPTKERPRNLIQHPTAPKRKQMHKQAPLEIWMSMRLTSLPRVQHSLHGVSPIHVGNRGPSLQNRRPKRPPS